MRSLIVSAALVVCAAAPVFGQNRWAEHYRQRVAAFQTENAALPAGKRHVVLVGDSLTEGFNASRVARFLPTLAGRVLNRGIISDRVGPPRGVLSRLESSIFDAQASHVVLLIGVNQIGRDGSGVKGALAHYRKILEAIKARSPALPVSLVTTPPARGGYAALNPHIQRFNAGVTQLAAEFGHSLIDLHPLLAGSDGDLRPELSADGLHWKDAGYAIYGREIAAAVAAADGGTSPRADAPPTRNGLVGAVDDED